MIMDEESFKKAILETKLPLLVLDNKWHRLFAVHGKPDEVIILEKVLRDLLARQGQLNNDLKSLKKIKNQLMQDIVSNMGQNEEKNVKDNQTLAMAENKRLIEETNAKMESVEDELLEIPITINDKNKELMLYTMSYCYSYLRKNKEQVDEIDEWIKKIRVELKKNIIRKQNRKINNREMYSYMHDVFGKDVINLFDVRVEDLEEEQKHLDELHSTEQNSTSEENPIDKTDFEEDSVDKKDTEEDSAYKKDAEEES